MALGTATIYFLILLTLTFFSLGKKNPLRKNRRYRHTVHRVRKHHERLLSILLVCSSFFVSYFALSKAVDINNETSAEPLIESDFDDMRSDLMARSMMMGGGGMNMGAGMAALKGGAGKASMMKSLKGKMKGGNKADMMKKLQAYGISHQ